VRRVIDEGVPTRGEAGEPFVVTVDSFFALVIAPDAVFVRSGH
jgi:hypothetical protein